MTKDWRTATGKKMKSITLDRILTVMARPDTSEWTMQALAQEIGISRNTLRIYLTPEVWSEINKQRLRQLVDSDILALDKALYTRALEGDLAAAKLIYTRWDSAQAAEKIAAQVVDNIDDKDIEQLDKALADLRAEIEVLEG